MTILRTNKFFKIIVVFTIITLLLIVIIFKFFSLQLVLLKNGYNILDYEIYRTDEFPDCKDIILKVYEKNGTFNYIIATKYKNCIGYKIIKEGKPSSKNRNYSSLVCDEITFNVEEQQFNAKDHKIFEIKKGNTNYLFNFNELPKNIGYIFKENDKYYTIDIYNKTEEALSDIPIFDINTLIVK